MSLSKVGLMLMKCEASSDGDFIEEVNTITKGKLIPILKKYLKISTFEGRNITKLVNKLPKDVKKKLYAEVMLLDFKTLDEEIIDDRIFDGEEVE